MIWSELDEEQKKEFKKYCDKRYGKPKVHSEDGEPLYYTGGFNLRVEPKMICEFLFGTLKK